MACAIETLCCEFGVIFEHSSRIGADVAANLGTGLAKIA
jgi:hypothetical protein